MRFLISCTVCENVKRPISRFCRSRHEGRSAGCGKGMVSCMEFYIGGFAQGKLEYVLKKYPGQDMEVIDGAAVRDMTEYQYAQDDTGKRIVLNRMHLWVRNLLAEGKNPEQCVKNLLVIFPDCIVISDEIGNGIVPVEREEREYRERLGRIQIELAKKAGRVERVICGLGQRLK